MYTMKNGNIVATGGASVYNGKWSAFDHVHKAKTPAEKYVVETVGRYLLSRGLVERRFDWITHEDIIVIQSRLSWQDKPSLNVFRTSLLKFLASNHLEQITVKNPGFSRQDLIDIRVQINNYIKGLAPKTVAGDKGPVFEPVLPAEQRLLYVI